MTDYVNHPENPTGSNLVAHALRELDLMGETSPEPPSMRECVVQIVRTFAEQGHSGSSAAWLSAVLDKLLRFQPLSPITDNPEDWIEVGPDLWQCRRDGECFSSNGGKTYARLGDRDTLHTSVSQAVRS
jgi:hypothetical protein